MKDDLEERVIPKENAVFWMDSEGDWHNEHGKFQHKKISDYFHISIDHDEKGYYVGQVNGTIKEKVYFKHEDTAMFVFNMVDDETLFLNTRVRVKLNPDDLYFKNDNLYVKIDDHEVKFVKEGLLNICEDIDFDDSTIKFKGKKYKIDTVEEILLHD